MDGTPADGGGPPADPEDWSDDQWIAWLETQDESDDDSPPPAAPARLQRSRGGQVLGNAMVGVANALYGRRDDDEVVAVAPAGEPDDDEDIEVRLDPDRPERSRVVFRRRR